LEINEKKDFFLTYLKSQNLKTFFPTSFFAAFVSDFSFFCILPKVQTIMASVFGECNCATIESNVGQNERKLGRREREPFRHCVNESSVIVCKLNSMSPRLRVTGGA
jgi:hypothetical protein